MSRLTFIRHGQANSGAKDEKSYDKLSDLGHQQARWLGEHLRSTGDHYIRVYSGTLRRHIETAKSMGADQFADIQQDERLNEFAYFTLAKAMEKQFGEPIPSTREGFADQLPRALAHWQKDELEDVHEAFEQFATRAMAAFDDICAGDGPALIISSGGIIGYLHAQTLGLDSDGWAKMCLATMNSSIHRWEEFDGKRFMTHFNGVPHLETPDRHFAQTHL